MSSEIQRLAEDVVETYFRWVNLLLLQCIVGAHSRSDCSCGHRSQNAENRLLIGVAGYVAHISVFMDSYWHIRRPAGCGKSTIAYPLINRINDILATRSAASCEKAISAVCVSLDGWHYTRAQLDQMDDPVKAHWWRVSDDNFDNVPKAHPFE